MSFEDVLNRYLPAARSLYYRLDGDRIEAVGNWLSPEYMAWSSDPTNLRIALDEVTPPGSDDGYRVSTVFLRMDHSYAWRSDIDQKPVLFETMVFREWRPDEPPEVNPITGGVLDETWDMSDLYCDRYTSRAEAEAGHRHVVELLERGGISALLDDDESKGPL